MEESATEKRERRPRTPRAAKPRKAKRPLEDMITRRSNEVRHLTDVLTGKATVPNNAPTLESAPERITEIAREIRTLQDAQRQLEIFATLIASSDSDTIRIPSDHKAVIDDMRKALKSA